MWTTKDRVVIRSQRFVYESDDILVQHWFMDWQNGTKDAVLTVMLLKNGKATINGISINTITSMIIKLESYQFYQHALTAKKKYRWVS